MLGFLRRRVAQILLYVGTPLCVAFPWWIDVLEPSFGAWRWVVWLPLIALWGGSTYLVSRARAPDERRAATRRWQRLLREHGFRDRLGRSKTGTLGLCDLRVELLAPDRQANVVAELTFEGRSPLPDGMVISKKSRGTHHTVGDESFDRQFWTRGPEDAVRALLDSDMRRSIEQIDGLRRLGFDGITLKAERPQRDVLRAVQTVLHGMRQRQATRTGRLRAVARTDRVAGVRIAVLTYALEQNPDDEAWLAVRDEMLASDDEELRLLVAKGAGEHGLPTLRALALDQNVLPWRRLEALETWATATDDPERADETLRALYADRLAGMRRRAVELALEKELPVDAGVLASVIAQLTGRALELAQLAIESSPDGEAALLAALGSDADAVRRWSLSQLEQRGTAAALPLLRRQIRGRVNTAEERAAARAIAAIEDRVQPAGGGSLSLTAVEEGGGGLSLPAAEAALSLSDDKKDG